jgi:hypothetical protein
MSDQVVPEEAPNEATPNGTPTDGVDWKKRYEDLRPQYDRTQNELQRFQTDPEYREQLFNDLASERGYELPTGEPEYDYEQDPAEAVRAELNTLKQEWQNFTAAQQQQAAISAAEAYSESKLDELGVENEKQREWIVSRATAMPALQHEGFIVPDVEAAFSEYKELIGFEQSSWAQSKRDVPFTPTGGQENTGVPAMPTDPDERSAERQRRMMERWNSIQSAS